LLILSGYSFADNIINKTGFIGEPCTTPMVDNLDDWMHWTDCIGPEVDSCLIFLMEASLIKALWDLPKQI
jgi:hypothetical protein